MLDLGFLMNYMGISETKTNIFQIPKNWIYHWFSFHLLTRKEISRY